MNIPNALRSFLGPALLLFCLSSAQAGIAWLSPELESLRQQAQREDKLFLLYFSAEWCAPCQWMEQHTFQDPQLGQYLQAHYLAAKVDLNNTASKRLQHQFAVDVIPSILVFATNGQLIGRRTATQEARPLLRWLRHLDRPAHHADASLPPDEAPVALASPQKQGSFSRPALLPDTPTSGLLTANERPATSANPNLILAGEPLALAENNFTPRSTLRYTILLQQTPLAYNAALQEITELERKYETRAELYPLGNGNFSIQLGQFATTGEARQFLQYLQRNDRQGEIVPLNDN